MKPKITKEELPIVLRKGYSRNHSQHFQPHPFPNCHKTYGTHPIKRKANIEKAPPTEKEEKNHNNRNRYLYLQRFSEIEAQKAAPKSPRGQSNYAALCIALHGKSITLGAYDPNATSIPGSISSDSERPGAGNESPGNSAADLVHQSL